MNNLLIHIPATPESKFVVYLALMNNFIGIIEDDKFKQNILTERELEVFSKLLYYNFMFNKLPIDARSRYLHSTDIRTQIKEQLKIDTNNYNNILNRLGKKVLSFNKEPLYNNGFINPLLAQNIDDYEGIEFKFQTINR